MKSEKDVQGVVLSGGLSRRLGTDKANVLLPDSGLTLLENAARVLSALGLTVHVCVREGQDRGVVWPQIQDSYDCPSSMCGVASCLKALAAPCLFTPCDMPFMTSAFLQRLLDARKSAPPDTLLTMFRMVDSTFMEPLTAIYEPDCLLYLERAMRERDYVLNRVIPREHVVFVDYTEEEARYFLNINTPDDLRIMSSGLPKV